MTTTLRITDNATAIILQMKKTPNNGSDSDVGGVACATNEVKMHNDNKTAISKQNKQENMT